MFLRLDAHFEAVNYTLDEERCYFADNRHLCVGD